MYGTILWFLIAITIQSLAPAGEPGPWTGSDAFSIVVLFAASWAVLRWRMRRHMVSALHSSTRTVRLRPLFPRLVQGWQGAVLLPYALLLYGTRYPALVMRPLSVHSEVFGSLAGLLPFVLLWVMVWWESFALHAVLFGRSGNRASFVRSHARMDLPILLPWLVAAAVTDLFRYAWPAGYEAFNARPILQLLYAPLFLLLAGIFLPILVTTMWGCKPLADGPRRRRIVELLDRLGVRVREVLDWPLLEGKVLSAGVVGITARFRYVLVTPALLDALGDEELDGVIAHEAGHVRQHHLWFYLFFFAGLMVALMALFLQGTELLLLAAVNAHPEWFRAPGAEFYVSVTLTAALAGFLLLGFRGVFGFVSRAFERQADIFALEVLGHPEPLISALERISYYSGDIRDLPSWHHGSVADRVGFLRDGAQDPSLPAEHHALVRRIRRGFAAALLVLAGAAVAVHLPSVDTELRWDAAEKGLDWRVRMHPREAGAWVARGSVRQERGRESLALADYEEALRIAPANPGALNASGVALRHRPFSGDPRPCSRGGAGGAGGRPGADAPHPRYAGGGPFPERRRRGRTPGHRRGPVGRPPRPGLLPRPETAVPRGAAMRPPRVSLPLRPPANPAGAPLAFHSTPEFGIIMRSPSAPAVSARAGGRP